MIIRVLVGMLLLNLVIVLWGLSHYIFPKCDWCKRRYCSWLSTSSFQNVFCSYRCNFWDMQDYIAHEAKLDIEDVGDMLSKRGWIHPDMIKGRK